MQELLYTYESKRYFITKGYVRLSPPSNMMLHGYSPTRDLEHTAVGHLIVDPEQIIDPFETGMTFDSPDRHTRWLPDSPPMPPQEKTHYRQGMSADMNIPTIGHSPPMEEPPEVLRDTGYLPFSRGVKQRTLFQAANSDGFIDLKQPARSMPPRLVYRSSLTSHEAAALAEERRTMLYNAKFSPHAGGVKREREDDDQHQPEYKSGQPPHKRGLYGTYPRGILTRCHGKGKGWVIIPPGFALPSFDEGVEREIEE